MHQKTADKVDTRDGDELPVTFVFIIIHTIGDIPFIHFNDGQDAYQHQEETVLAAQRFCSIRIFRIKEDNGKINVCNDD